MASSSSLSAQVRNWPCSVTSNSLHIEFNDFRTRRSHNTPDRRKLLNESFCGHWKIVVLPTFCAKKNDFLIVTHVMFGYKVNQNLQIALKIYQILMTNVVNDTQYCEYLFPGHWIWLPAQVLTLIQFYPHLENKLNPIDWNSIGINK